MQALLVLCVAAWAVTAASAAPGDELLYNQVQVSHCWHYNNNVAPSILPKLLIRNGGSRMLYFLFNAASGWNMLQKRPLYEKPARMAYYIVAQGVRFLV